MRDKVLIDTPEQRIAEFSNKLREAQRFLESYDDEGPYGEGWKSKELRALIEWIDLKCSGRGTSSKANV